MQRLIPLPDYCYDHSPIVVSVLNSVYDGVEYVGHSGLMVKGHPLLRVVAVVGGIGLDESVSSISAETT